MSVEVEAPILLADADPVFGDLVEAYLNARGYRVRRVRDGRRALEALAEHRIRVVVSALELPGIDGLEVAASCALLPTPTPVVLTTHDPAIEAWPPAQLSQLGVTHIVRRPCRLGALVEAIERATDTRAPRPSLRFAALPRAQN